MDSASITTPTKTVGHETVVDSTWPKFPRDYLAVFAVYVLVTLFVRAHFMADTADYVGSVVAYDTGRQTDFWEFGHLFWRPLLWFFYVLVRPVTKQVVGGDPGTNVIVAGLIINWISGLVSVFALHALCGRFCKQRWIVYLTTIIFIFSHGFLNYFQTGCSYVPALMLLLVGWYFLARCEVSAAPLRTAVLTGLILALSVCLWFPFLFALPAVLLSPLILCKFDRQTLRHVLITGCFIALFGAAAYGSIAVGVLGITSVHGFRAWMAAASHDTEIRGVTRMVFGFARSFIFMGNDGMLFKRYLLKDPFNTVTLLDLLRLSLWKLALFYLVMAAICISLLRSAMGRRVLILLVVGAVPILLFAILFDGGAIERYFPLYPVVFFALALSLYCPKPLPGLKYLVMIFGAAVIVANASAMAKPVQDREQESSANRIDALLPVLKPHSRIMTVNWQDDLINFGRSFPLHPINRRGELQIGALVTPGTTYAQRWREDFATNALKAWREGGDVWVSRRALSTRPLSAWNWAEGDVEGVSWKDFSPFFAQLETGDSIGGDDGFFRVLPTPKNQEFLSNVSNKKHTIGMLQTNAVMDIGRLWYFPVYV